MSKEDIIGLFILIAVIGFIVVYFHFQTTAPCEDFSGSTTQYLPARCLEYWTKGGSIK